MADAVVKGASDPEITLVDVRVLSALQADVEDVSWCDAVILGTPENFGYMSGALKYFFDRIYYPCLDSTQGLPYALFVRAGNDGTGAVASVERIVAGLKWRAIQDPVICAGDLDDACVHGCRDLGTLVAAGLEAGIF